MYFHGLWQISPSWVKLFSERAQGFISCVFYIWNREKRSCCCASCYQFGHWPFFIPQVCYFWYQRDSRNEPHWLCCHSPNWSAGIEKLPGILDPGRETKTSPQAGPHQIQFLAIRIQAFHLMGSVSSLEHKYSSPESSLYMTVIYDALKITTGERVCRLTFQNVFKIPLKNILLEKFTHLFLLIRGLQLNWTK